MDVIFLALPHTGAWLPEADLNRKKFSAKRRCIIGHGKTIAATKNYNDLWCGALNSRVKYGLTHFARLDSDIVVGVDYCGDVLIDRMQEVGADIISAVVPIKDDTGITSTGITLPGLSFGNDVAVTRRLTQKEIFQLPETFTAEDVKATFGYEGNLAVNTGFFACDFTQPWVEHICENGDVVRGWTCTDVIFQRDGEWLNAIDTEDWKFARWAAEYGLKVCATRIPLGHRGISDFDVTDRPWGHWDTDHETDKCLATHVREFNQGDADDMSGPVGQKS